MKAPPFTDAGAPAFAKHTNVISRIGAVAALAFASGVLHAQQPPQPALRPGELTADQDHKRIMDLLGMVTIREGANGNNPNAPNAANYDEAKANPYPALPDALLTQGRVPVTTSDMWWSTRRPEIVELFDREVYGRVPANVPSVKWTVKSVKDTVNGTVPITVKELVGHADNSAFPEITVDILVTLSTPAKARWAVPVVLQFSGGGFGPPPGFGAPQGPGWQSQMLARGWGYATINTGSVQQDNGSGLMRGIIGLANRGQPRKLDDWGVLRAWAWGASRALDYFETDKAVDAKHVGLEGHSRWGKATVIAMAYDQRFAIAYVSSSGEGGVKLNRRNAGEIVENVAGTGEYHWMAGNFLKYAGPLTWDDLPVDAHELLAMCAPRPVFISGGANGDAWVDSRGMFMAAVAAEPVYQLLGKKGLGTSTFPAVEQGLMGGDIAFRQHASGHTDGPNWPTFLTFAERYFGVPKTTTGSQR